METIEQLLDQCQLAGVTVWKVSDDRYQASTKGIESEGWSVHYGDTPGAALRAALEFRVSLLGSTKVDDPKPRPSFL